MKALMLTLFLLAEPAQLGTAREAVAAPFSCPAGAERKGGEPPDAFELWCEKPGEPPERRRDGPSRTWYDDGGLAKEAGFKDGRLHGTFTEWHRNGKPARAGVHEQGARAGTWTIWYESGRKEEECGYAGGERHGVFAAWWPNGKRRVEGRYCYGLQCGAWTSWDEEGRQLGRMQYEEVRRTP